MRSALVLSVSLAAACFFPLKSYAYLVITGNGSASQVVNETAAGTASAGTGTFDAAFYAASIRMLPLLWGQIRRYFMIIIFPMA